MTGHDKVVGFRFKSHSVSSPDSKLDDVPLNSAGGFVDIFSGACAAHLTHVVDLSITSGDGIDLNDQSTSRSPLGTQYSAISLADVRTG